MSRARLGQHFLVDRRVRQRILDALRLSREHRVLEIGAGRGAMTGLLAERAGYVAAVEVDPRLAAGLREKFSGEARVEVVEGDFLKLVGPAFFHPTAPKAGAAGAPVLPAGSRDLESAGRQECRPYWRVFGNLPYYITSPILTRLFEHAAEIEEIVVMVQKEVAERLVAAPGSRDYGLLSVTAQFYTRPELLFTIPPGAFDPRPKVDSALVRMTVKPRAGELGIADEAGFFRLLRAAFQQKRKTLANNLKALYGKARLEAALAAAGIPSRARAEALALEQFVALFRELHPRED